MYTQNYIGPTANKIHKNSYKTSIMNKSLLLSEFLLITVNDFVFKFSAQERYLAPFVAMRPPLIRNIYEFFTIQHN